MFFRRFSFALFFGLLLILGFMGMRHRSGYAQGFEQGYAAAAQEFAAIANAPAETAPEPVAPAPSAPVQNSHQSWGLSPGFGVFGMFFKFFLLMAAISVFMKLIFPGRRHRGRRHFCGSWKHHGDWEKWGHGSKHHRSSTSAKSGRPQKGDDDYEKQPEDVEPDVRSY